MEYRNDKIEDLLMDDSFIRWINEEADALEIERWENWIRKDPANASKYHEAIELYRGLRFQEEVPDTLLELNILNESLSRVGPHRTRQTSNYRISLSIAALLLLGLLFLFKNIDSSQTPSKIPEQTLTEVTTSFGQIQKINFPDGSSVTLNANSTLKYPEPFLRNDVEFVLDGEAYFSIEPFLNNTGERRRFAVKTESGVVNILGTSFNVNTRNSETKVVLDHGEVEVINGFESEISSEKRYVMTPGELAIFSALHDRIDVSKVRADLYTSWRNLIWIFDEISLFEIAERIESTYGIDVEITDKKTGNMKFSGTAPNENLSVLLEGLRTLLKVPIKEDIDVIIIGWE